MAVVGVFVGAYEELCDVDEAMPVTKHRHRLLWRITPLLEACNGRRSIRQLRYRETYAEKSW